jgi:hypothetical protein
MAEVKALFYVGKTQWAKWRPEQRTAFNEFRAEGVPFDAAVARVNGLELVEVNIAPAPAPEPKPKRAPAKKKGA